MPSPVDERMDALSGAIQRLLRRMAVLEARLTQLEAAQGIAEPAPPEPQRSAEPAPPPVVPRHPPVVQPPAPPAVAPPPAPVPPPSSSSQEPPHQMETRVGLTWVNRVGVVTLVFAVAFFFKYAVDNQWIGETGRVILGVLAGFATLGFGEIFWRKGHAIYAQGITATGLAVLYLSFFASFGFYHLVPQGAAFVLMALTTVIAGVLAICYNAMAISVLALVGGYLTPLLLSTGVDRPWVLFPYLLLLDAGAVAVAHARRWRPLEQLALASTVCLYAAWFTEHFTPEKQLVAAASALAFYALFVFAESPVPFAVAQMGASLAMVAISPPGAAVYLSLLLILAAAGLAVSERRGWESAVSVTFGSFWVLGAAWQADLLRPSQFGWILLAFTGGFLLFLGWAAWRIFVKRAEPRREDLAVLALNGAAYFGICYHLLLPDYEAYLGLFAALLAGVHLAFGMQIWKAQAAEHRDARPVLLLVGVALGFLTLAAPIQFSGYRITMAWALEAAALSWIGVRTGSRRLVYCALGVFVLTLGRLHGIDAWIYPRATAYHAIANARFLTFGVAAACLWLGANWIRPRREALAPYLAGHFVLLWALVMEVVGWAERTAPTANVADAVSVSVSALLAAYGVLLVASGVLTRLGINRILGLGLLTVVVLKLYVYDVWQLARLYRVVAFGFLGALLLGTSFLYSHHRSAIEKWWRDEKSGS